MTTMYKDWDNDSNIFTYDIGIDYIVVEFKSGRCRNYRYTYYSAGRDSIEQMKLLAKQNEGLNSFISIYKPRHDSQW